MVSLFVLPWHSASHNCLIQCLITHLDFYSQTFAPLFSMLTIKRAFLEYINRLYNLKTALLMHHSIAHTTFITDNLHNGSLWTWSVWMCVCLLRTGLFSMDTERKIQSLAHENVLLNIVVLAPRFQIEFCNWLDIFWVSRCNGNTCGYLYIWHWWQVESLARFIAVQFWVKITQKIFYPDFGYFAVTFEPETLKSLSKAQKDPDFNLVSTKNLSKIPRAVGAQAPITSAKNSLNQPH